MSSQHNELIGQVADRIDNLIGAQQLSIEQLRQALTQIRNTLRLVYIAQTREDPWASHDRSHLTEGSDS